jgi:hypothetical protein
MNSWGLLGSFQGVIRAETVDEAGAGLREALATGPKLRTIRLLLDPTREEIMPWLEAVRVAHPEIRGLLVQRFFARIFRRAGYEVVVGRELDIFAKSRFRSLFVEVKSSLAGGRFGSQTEITQLDAYLIASERRAAETWLGVMGIKKPIRLHDAFKSQMRARNIGLIDIRWISPMETLLPHLFSSSV